MWEQITRAILLDIITARRYNEFTFSETKFIKGGAIMFVGREKELSLLKNILNQRSGSVMIYGKRKVGKTTLTDDYMLKSRTWEFSEYPTCASEPYKP